MDLDFLVWGILVRSLAAPIGIWLLWGNWGLFKFFWDLDEDFILGWGWMGEFEEII